MEKQSAEIKTLSVQCPVCKTEVLMTKAFPHRPFCSERCKLLDFGGWASEAHRISSNSGSEDDWSEEQTDN